jgi:hypothetical protein
MDSSASICGARRVQMDPLDPERSESTPSPIQVTLRALSQEIVSIRVRILIVKFEHYFAVMVAMLKEPASVTTWAIALPLLGVSLGVCVMTDTMVGVWKGDFDSQGIATLVLAVVGLIWLASGIAVNSRRWARQTRVRMHDEDWLINIDELETLLAQKSSEYQKLSTGHH